MKHIQWEKLWDTQDVNDLKKIIAREQGLCDEHDELNVDDLPLNLDTAHLIEGHEHYPIWAIDANGYCLVGETLEDVEHIDDVLEMMSERLPS